MRPWLLGPVAALLIWPVAASAQSQAPDEAQLDPPPSGGVEFGVDPRPARPAPTRPLRVSDFEVSPSTVVAGAVTTVRVRITGGNGRVRVTSRVSLARRLSIMKWSPYWFLMLMTAGAPAAR